MAGIDTYTKLCLHGEGADAATTFRDASSGHKSITAGGTAQIDTAQKKFGAGSILLDGSDGVYAATSTDWAFGTGAYTIDFWARFTTLPASAYSSVFYTQFVDVNNRIVFQITNNSGQYEYRFRLIVSGTDLAYITLGAAPTTVVTGTWYHIAFVRDGQNHYIFQDGNQCGSTYVSSTTYTVPNFGVSCYFGCYYDVANGINGWMDEYRVSKGIARWTANFTPPTEAYSLDVEDVVDAVTLHDDTSGDKPDTGVDANTVLLLHGEGADAATSFIDSGVGHKTITRSGSAQIDTAQKKFGAASVLLGNFNYLTLADSADWCFGTGDFTIDLWVRFASLPGSSLHYMFCSQYVDSNNRWYFSVYETAGTYRLTFNYKNSTGTASISRTITPSINTWYHYAVTKSGSYYKLYCDGVQLSTEYTSTLELTDLASSLFIGTWYAGGGLYHDGWIDELRISKGVARWTASFTLPTAPYGTDLSTPEALTTTALVVPDPGLPTDADMTEGFTTPMMITTSTGVIYLLDIDEDIGFNDTVVPVAEFFKNVSETAALNEVTAGSGSFIKTMTEALTTDDYEEGQYAITMRADDQVFPGFTNESKKNQVFKADAVFPKFITESHRGALATQKMSNFDTSAHMFITFPYRLDLNAPKFKGEGVMLTGRVFSGDTVFPKMAGEATAMHNPKFTCDSKMVKPKCYATMHISGRFTDYVMRYVR